MTTDQRPLEALRPRRVRIEIGSAHVGPFQHGALGLPFSRPSTGFSGSSRKVAVEGRDPNEGDDGRTPTLTGLIALILELPCVVRCIILGPIFLKQVFSILKVRIIFARV